MASKSLNEEFFNDILQKDYEKYSIKNFTVESAVPKGENYASVLSRVRIVLELPGNVEVTKYYLVKAGQDSDYAGYVNETLFPKEKEIYRDIIPQFEALFKEFGVDVKLAPKCVKIVDKCDTIVLEDLRPQKYENIKRQLGMDMKHAKATLERLAQFHAASACIAERNGPYSKQFGEGLYQDAMVPIYSQMFGQMWPLLYGSMKQWEGCQEYVEKIKAKKDTMIERLMGSLKTNPAEFNVLNHGDFWSNNIMFQYNDEGEIQDLLLIDFQLCKWGSPAQDLQHFIITSCSSEIKIVEFESLIRYYYSHLVDNLKLLGYGKAIPSLEDLEMQTLKRGFYGVNTSISILSAVLLDPEASIQQRVKIYSNPRYVEAMKELLPFFDKRGLLDF